MRTLSFALGLMLLLIIAPSCSADTMSVQDIPPEKCCFDFSSPIPRHMISSINTTDPRCPQPAFLIITGIGQEFCAKQTDRWAKRAYDELHPKQPYSSRTMSSMAMQETPPEKCCFEFSPPIPPNLVTSITATNTRCPKPAFLITTVKGRELCARQTARWAKRVYDELYPNHPDSSSVMSTMSMQEISHPEKCCFEFSPPIPRHKISSINATNTRCPEPAFLILTVIGRELCARQEALWAKTAYDELHPNHPDSSSVMSTVQIQEIPPARCCFEFSSPIPRHMISSINVTDTRCSKPAFLITTVKEKELCANPEACWAKRAFKELHPNHPDTSSTTCTVELLETPPESCCFEFSPVIPRHMISSINATDTRCPEPVFLIITDIGQEFCANQTDPWAKRVYDELHPKQPDASSIMSTVQIQETPPEKCCSEFSPPIPRHMISSITATNTRCPEPVFLIRTGIGQEFCAKQTDPWAKTAYDELHPKQPYSSRTMSISISQLLPDQCCFEFLTKEIPPSRIVSISTTSSRCSEPAFVIETKTNRKLCVRRSAPWAQKLYEKAIN